ncbi:GGDEF domain-containing protein [Neptunicella marina]|uniref:diguanylate cyclase n=1 Tax=Neptunicella marina TaxID=2125989 RepID=A0A8J6IRD5_9ALTE|nr:GGDEF domain-containing protein [Neptunicella marina]MBC3764909.1 diguanylate cyclase [Neptunicella marina]
MMHKPPELLQKELEQAKQQQQKLVRSFKRQIDVLSQFIIRLSLFYADANHNIDEELAQLRGHLGGKSNFAMAENSIGKITKLLVQEADIFTHQGKLLQSQIQNALKALQLKTTVKSEINQQCIKVLGELHQQHLSLYKGLPYVQKALLLYQQALALTDKTASDDIDKNKINSLHKRICAELSQLIEQLASQDTPDRELQRIRIKLIDGITHEELLQCCLILIRTILKDVVKERDHAEKFVSSIHQVLIDLNQQLDDSIKHTNEVIEQKQQNHQQMQAHIDNIENVVSEASDLQQLKQQTQQYLQKLNKSLAANTQIDHEEQGHLLSLLNAMQSQITELEQQADQYKQKLIKQRQQNETDVLTGVANRNAYLTRAQTEYERWQRYQHPLAIALIDIDHFKRINDTFGHSAGDKTLQVIAQQIQTQIRNTDFLARWGGEEFILLLPDTDLEQLSVPLSEIGKRVEKIPFKFKTEQVTITVSIGATTLQPEDTLEEAFERADQALYKAKSSGRNRFIIG